MTEVQAELDRARLEDGIAVITPEMAFRDTIAAWRAKQALEQATADDVERAVNFLPRATPARALRLRLYTDRLEGPAWLGLLCQCAWLRGIIGDALPSA